MPPYSIFFLIFAAAILLYGLIQSVTKDPKMLPYNIQVSVKGKSKTYLDKLGKCIALGSLAPAIAAVVGIWSVTGMLIAFVVVLAATLWLSTKIVKDVK